MDRQIAEITELSNDLNVITAEINSYKQVAGQAIFEIGKRLKHVKENDLVHGEFGKWLESIDMSHTQANRFMKVYEEIPQSKITHVGQIGLRVLYEIATLPLEEREKEHTLSGGEIKTVDEMTVRELQEVKRSLKEEKRLREQAERERDQARNSEQIAIKKIEEMEEREPEVIEKVIKVEDTSRIKALERDLLLKKEQNEQVIRERDSFKRELEFAHESEQDIERLQQSILQLSERKDGLQQDIEDIEEIMKYVVKIEKIKEEGMSPLVYSKAIRRQSSSQVVDQTLKEIVYLVGEWHDDMQKILYEKEGKIIEMEVLDNGENGLS